MAASCRGEADFNVCKRRDQALLDLGEIGAERKCRQQAGIGGRLQRALDRIRRVVARRRRQRERPLDLAGILGLAQQFALEARVGDRQHRGDDVAVAFAADVGDAVFRHDDVAQMARDGGVAVAPADIRLGLAFRRARRVQQDRRARAFERKALRDEIVLAADAADDAAVFEAVRNHVAEQRSPSSRR